MLAASVARGAIPQPDVKPDPVRRTNYALKSGNLQYQQYNTGLAGYRLTGIPALYDQLSSHHAHELFRGDSDRVAA